MITVTRIAGVVPGKQAKALAFMHELVAISKAMDGPQRNAQFVLK